jgi:hypothetical protein
MNNFYGQGNMNLAPLSSAADFSSVKDLGIKRNESYQMAAVIPVLGLIVILAPHWSARRLSIKSSSMQK